MPTSTIYSTTADEFVEEDTSNGSWDDAQGSATTDGGSFHNGRTAWNWGVYARNAGSRGANDYKCNRSYFVFDLSGESGIVETATISIYMDNLGTSTGNSAKAIIVEATALDGGVEDHGNVFSSGTTWHNDITNSTPISTTAGFHGFTVNSDGITLIQNATGSGSITVGLVSWYHDYSENVPLGGGDYSQFYVRYSDYFGTGSNPQIEITYVVADNATFFGANF